ncbi:MAG: response regulator [Methanoregula sp.]
MMVNCVPAGCQEGKETGCSACFQDTVPRITGRPKILIVEDEAVLAEDLREMLEQSGFLVCPVFCYGEDAVAEVAHLQPDLILMDIHLMGEMDGIRAAAQIRSLYPIPIVFLSIFSDAETLSRAMKTHPCGYLVKPFVKETVYTTIRAALANHQYITRARAGSVCSVPVLPEEPEIQKRTRQIREVMERIKMDLAREQATLTGYLGNAEGAVSTGSSLTRKSLNSITTMYSRRTIQRNGGRYPGSLPACDTVPEMNFALDETRSRSAGVPAFRDEQPESRHGG